MTRSNATMTIDPGNAEQAQAWNGDSGAVWVEHDGLFNESVSLLTVPFLTAAAITDGEHVLDIGCGSGETTRDVALRTPHGSAVGIDLSGPLLALAEEQTRQAGIGNASFVQADAQVHPFEPGSFDVAISRTGAMFFADPVAAFGNIGRALRSGGRLALLVWQDAALNDWFVSFTRALAGPDEPLPPPGSPGPFSLAVPDQVRSILGSAGFVDVAFEARHDQMPFGTVDAGYALTSSFFGWRLRDLDEAAAGAALAALRATLTDHVVDGEVRFDSAAWIVTARRP